MINITNRPQAPYPQTVTVHEHRASTDESIRLLAEMQEKARRSLIESVDVKDNQLSFTYQVYDEFPSGDKKLYCKISLNGHHYIIERRVDNGAYLEATKTALIDTIATVVMRDIIGALAKGIK